MKLIAIVGKKRSGKDTAANYVLDKNGVKHQLAGPIKDSLTYAWFQQAAKDDIADLYEDDWEGNGAYDREKPLIINNGQANNILRLALQYCESTYAKFPVHPLGKALEALDNLTLNNTECWTMRRFMQTLGTDIVCTHIDSMYWIKIFACNYVDLLYSENDYYVVPDVRQQNELDTLRAMGATILHVVREDSDQVKDTHITEAGLPISPGDIVIENDGSLNDLYSKIDKVL